MNAYLYAIGGVGRNRNPWNEKNAIEFDTLLTPEEPADFDASHLPGAALVVENGVALLVSERGWMIYALAEAI